MSLLNPLVLTLIACIPFTLLVGSLWLVQRQMDRTALLLPVAGPVPDERPLCRTVVQRMQERRAQRAIARREPGTGNRELDAGDRGTTDLRRDIKRQEAIVQVIAEWQAGKRPTGDRVKVLVGVRKDFALELIERAKPQIQPAPSADADPPLSKLTPQPHIQVPEFTPPTLELEHAT